MISACPWVEMDYQLKGCSFKAVLTDILLQQCIKRHCEDNVKGVSPDFSASLGFVEL